MSNKKKMVLKITVYVFLVLAVLTGVSQAVSRATTPEVTVTEADFGAITEQVKTTATLNYKNTDAIYAGGGWTVSNVFVSEGDQVEKGDKIFSIDTAAFELQKLQKQQEIQTLNNTYWGTNWTGGDRAALELQMEAAKLDYAQLLAQYPAGGVFCAPQAGIVKNLGVTVGTVFSKYEKMFDLVPTAGQVTYELEWTVSSAAMNKYLSENQPSASYVDENGDKVEKLLTVASKKQNADGSWAVAANWPFDMAPDFAKEYKVEMGTSLGNYPEILPRSCIHSDVDKYSIFVVKTRSGIFGDENYVEKVEVELLAENDNKAAVRAYDLPGALQGEKVVQYVSQEISNGDVVLVREEA